MNPKDICTGPPQKWLAIHKDGRIGFPVLRINLPINDYHSVDVVCSDGLAEEWKLSDCYLCASTGYTDSKEGEVFGGHILKWPDDDEPIVVVWDKKKKEWWGKSLHVDYTDDSLNDFCIEAATIIGHIHIQPWPDEVKEVLYEVKKVSDE